MKWSSIALALVLCVAPLAHAQESSPAARAALAHELYDSALTAMSSGVGTPSAAYDWSVRWMRAELEGHTATAAQAHFDRMTTLLARVHSQVATGTARPADELACRFYLAEARAWLSHPPTVP
jgi:hypothetical protein